MFSPADGVQEGHPFWPFSVSLSTPPLAVSVFFSQDSLLLFSTPHDIQPVAQTALSCCPTHQKMEPPKKVSPARKCEPPNALLIFVPSKRSVIVCFHGAEMCVVTLQRVSGL